MIILNADVEGETVDVELEAGRVARVGRSLDGRGRPTIDAAGGALLPGLHDHHVHLNAMAAARRSVDVGPTRVQGPDGLRRALIEAPLQDGTVRATGYHEDVAGDLDRWRLDELLGEFGTHTPVRIQHRSGSLWILNSRALELAETVLDRSVDVGRNCSGVPDGRLWRYDDRLRPLFRRDEADHRRALAEVREKLLSYGVVGVTDATPEMSHDEVAVLGATAPLRISLMCDASPASVLAGSSLAARKIVLRDHDLPTVEVLAQQILAARGDAERPVAVHCVSREALVTLLLAWEQVPAVPGDRIEHGAVIPGELAALLRLLPVSVVTQPGFLHTRGDQYLQHVPADDLPYLYRWQGLCDGGIDVLASSDAPYGPADPWQAVRAARDRLTPSGQVIAATERATPLDVLRTYWRDPDTGVRQVRRIIPGAPADVCLLHVPLAEALRDPSADNVRATWVDGSPM